MRTLVSVAEAPGLPRRDGLELQYKFEFEDGQCLWCYATLNTATSHSTRIMCQEDHIARPVKCDSGGSARHERIGRQFLEPGCTAQIQDYLLDGFQ